MTPKESEQKLLAALKKLSPKLQEIPITDAFDAMINFYGKVRVEDCDLDEDGDMLLFQCGVHSFDDSPETVQINITRQFIQSESELDEDDEEEEEEESDDEEDDADDEEEEDSSMSQLQLTYHFDPAEVDPEVFETEESSRWHGEPKKTTSFRDFITTHPAFVAVQTLKPMRVEVVYDLI